MNTYICVGTLHDILVPRSPSQVGCYSYAFSSRINEICRIGLNYFLVRAFLHIYTFRWPSPCAQLSVAGSSRCLAAICIALEQDRTHKWYVSTMDLQQVSFQLCVACRSFRSFCVIVDEHMPLSLWGCDYSMDVSSQVTNNRGVPSLRASRALCRIFEDTPVPGISDSTLVNWSNFMKLELYDFSRYYISFQDLGDSCSMLWQQLLTSEILSPLRFLGAVKVSFSILVHDNIRGARSSKEIDVLRLACWDK